MADGKCVLRLPASDGTHRTVESVHLPPHQRQRFPRQQSVWDVGLWGGPPIASTSGSTPAIATPAARSGSDRADGELFNAKRRALPVSTSSMCT